jgi:DNA-binding HxlR family transcriptional regulator
MRWKEVGETHCSVARTLSVIGDPWTLLILRDVFLGIRRFDDFQSRLNVTRHLLSDRLKKLVQAGILRREPYQERPVRYEYRLTEKGHELFPVLMALVQWGDRWMSGNEAPPLTLTHRPCGHVMTPIMVCPHCQTPVVARDTEAQPRPNLANGRK